MHEPFTTIHFRKYVTSLGEQNSSGTLNKSLIIGLQIFKADEPLCEFKLTALCFQVWPVASQRDNPRTVHEETLQPCQPYGMPE